MLNRARQSSNGNLSPNIEGDFNNVTYEAGTKINPAQEVKTMLAVVNAIPQVARTRLEKTDFSFEYGTKDLHEKFEVRFKSFSPLLKRRIAELSLLYRSAYDVAKSTSDIGEFDYEELLDRLRQLSIKALEQEGGNPVDALRELREWFENQFKSQSDVDYSIGAIEYFLYMELMNCNIFPNSNDSII